MAKQKRSLNLNYFLKRNLGYYNSKKVNSVEELETLHKNNRYVEKRSLSEYYKTLECMNADELKHKKRVYGKKKKYSLYNEVKNIKRLRTDKFYTKTRYGKMVVVKDRFTITRKEFEQTQKELFTFLSMIMMTNKYGLVIDGIGHMYVENGEIKLNPYKIENSGTFLKNMNIKTKGYTKELLSHIMNKGQEYATIDKEFKNMFKSSGRRQINTKKHNIKDYVNIDEIAMTNTLLELAKKLN